MESRGWEDSPEGGHGNSLQYSCLENPMDRGAGGLQSIELQRVGHDCSDLVHTHSSLLAMSYHYHGRCGDSFLSFNSLQHPSFMVCYQTIVTHRRWWEICWYKFIVYWFQVKLILPKYYGLFFHTIDWSILSNGICPSPDSVLFIQWQFANTREYLPIQCLLV